MSLRYFIAAIALFVSLAGCPRPTRRTLVPEVPQNGDVSARTRFNEARTRFLQDGGGPEAFQKIVRDFPEDPIVPWANLYAGIAAIRDRKFAAAKTSLEAAIAANVDAGLTTRAELFLGITKNYLGDAAGALPLLRRGQSAIENETEKTEYLAAAAFATATAGEQPLQSLGLFDQLYARVSATEQAVIVARCEEVVARADRESLRRVFDQLQNRQGPAMAAVATRLALLADVAGATDEAKQMREVAGPARVAVGLPRTISTSGAASAVGEGEAGLLGAVMPLGGKQNRVAEAAVAGLGAAAGVGDGKGVVAVEVRAAGDAAAAALAVEELTKASVIAIVGPIDGAAVDAASVRAESLGVPLLSMSTRAEERTAGRYTFHVVHSSEARARALARTAIDKGVTTFAMLSPDSGYGKAVSAAFADEVSKAGGSIVTKITYPADSKSFASFAGKLDGSWQGVFVPEQADRLELIAPALMAAGKVPAPVGTKKVSAGRPIVLLSTAEGITGSYIAAAGRHSHGALFAPGYYPDDKSATQKVFLERFIATFGRAPGAIEAYAFDAAQLVAAAGTGGRAALAQKLATGELTGVTGVIKFDGERHVRSDRGVIYTVTEDSGAYAIRTLP